MIKLNNVLPLFYIHVVILMRLFLNKVESQLNINLLSLISFCPRKTIDRGVQGKVAMNYRAAAKLLRTYVSSWPVVAQTV